MTLGTLIKVTNKRKLMIKIEEPTFKTLQKRFLKIAQQKDLDTDRLPTFTLDNDSCDGVAAEEENYFIMLSLDKYDKPNCSRYEKMKRKLISFNGQVVTYAFIPEGETEQLTGMNFELTGSIRVIKPKVPVVSEVSQDEDDHATALVNAILNPTNNAAPPHSKLTELEQSIDADVEEQVAATNAAPPHLMQKKMVKKLSEIEQHMKKLDECDGVALDAEEDELPLSPPKLIRQ